MMLKYTHANANIKNSSSQKGFTLIELSIVLVVIGLIVAGITSGASLIKQATLRSVIAEVRNYQLAVNTFVLTYNALPGDFITTSTALSAATTGDGSGLVDGNEFQTAFQMLGLASLINSNYASASYPKSKYSGAEYLITNNNSTTAATSIYGKIDNSITLRAISTATAGNSTGGITPGDAQNIDAKIDDGIAYKGGVYASKSLNTSTALKCTKSATLPSITSPVAADDYALTDLTPTCVMYFWVGN